ncbi:MAG TPA: hypothetical protein VKU82_03170 [Planctomycetaceae bacterium]|nr:hypothetical protein [Planctomycetaceae bacterium]
MVNSTPAKRHRYPGRLVFLLGVGLPLVGIITYAVQLGRGRLATPWHMAIDSTLAVGLLAVAFWQARKVWRALAFILVLLLAGAEWTFLVGTRLPAYSGPVAAGKALPAFSTSQADGTPFTQRDLVGSQNNVLVFFRGRW